MSEQRTSKEWATRARFEKIKAEMPEGIPGYSEFRFDWMHDALRELIDYCDALHAVEPETVRPEDLAAALAHRACCGVEHDPAQGKLHGYCVVCGVPWPCDTAKHFLRPPPTEPAK